MFRTISYTLKIPHLPKEFDGFRIAHLSDLHGQQWGSDYSLLIEPVFRFQPDMAAFTGDMAGENMESFPRLFTLAKKLSDFCPVFYGLGNHETRMPSSSFQTLTEGLKNAGVRILDNSSAEIIRSGSALKIYGLNLPMIYYKDPLCRPYDKNAWFSLSDMERLLGPCSQAEPAILLAHHPAYFPTYEAWGAALTLSGHIHGGIIRLPFLGGLLSPDVTFFPKYDGGYFSQNNRHLIISRGLSSQFLIRINNPMELIFITLRI